MEVVTPAPVDVVSPAPVNVVTPAPVDVVTPAPVEVVVLDPVEEVVVLDPVDEVVVLDPVEEVVVLVEVLELVDDVVVLLDAVDELEPVALVVVLDAVDEVEPVVLVEVLDVEVLAPVEDVAVVVVPVPVDELAVDVVLAPPIPPMPPVDEVVVDVALAPPIPPIPPVDEVVVDVTLAPPAPPRPPVDEVVVDVALDPPRPPVDEVLVAEPVPESGPASQGPHRIVPPHPFEMDPHAPGGHTVTGVHAAQMSSREGSVDCWHVAGAVHSAVAAVHCSQPPKSTLPPFVSHTGVPPLQASPSSPQEHLRHPVSVVPEQTAWVGPVLVHLPCWLLQSCCTTQLRPDTVMVSPGLPSAQMSAISPQLLSLSPQAAGAA